MFWREFDSVQILIPGESLSFTCCCEKFAFPKFKSWSSTIRKAHMRSTPTNYTLTEFDQRCFIEAPTPNYYKIIMKHVVLRVFIYFLCQWRMWLWTRGALIPVLFLIVISRSLWKLWRTRLCPLCLFHLFLSSIPCSFLDWREQYGSYTSFLIMYCI